ncbi:ABC transporter permease [Enterococcus phoeniculicola]|jgi:putative ABC transport system permease protein|uniref:ABC3 transporter permease C-terminal domain-containing protein n=1 Tax=Enterococcus phoeniculicola ATCC BAA-412 TaxID=1158610 RepID=R3WLR0_9ENTE|nr:ABC transporter permease [Enterococcus phoeniculicola]EOL48786.1 hypothetical protein UC3_00337 [Enterococcus phoeniculicola ATCC BAA-412]EOT72632.1 hypothetical protein I589_02901 [Enterococcus phoeniculicola ATCC BAA-412]
MKLRNNNRTVIRTLSKANYKHNQSRNWLMIGAVATTVLVLFCIFSFMKGRIDAEYIMEVRHNGVASTTSLDRPTNLQKKEIERLSYIDRTGKVYGFSEGKVNGTSRFAGVVADNTAFEKMFVPAYSDIHGAYPKKENELMLSIRGLEELGITNPTLGMKIPVEIYMDKGKSENRTFLLSGFYTEYVHPIEGPPIGFFSEIYLNHLGFSMNNPTNLLIQQKNWYPGEDIEQMLYNDVDTIDEIQKFGSANSVSYNVIRRTVGGYDIAFLSIAILIICVFLLNYNVMNISVSREIRYYGLLKTIGATNRQIRRTIYQQFLKISLIGLLIGSGISLVIILGIAPKILSKYYLNNYGLSSQMIQFEPILLIGSVGLTLLLSFISILLPAYKAGKITPIESLNYIGPKTNKKRRRKGQEGAKLHYMAWRNLWRNRRATVLSMLSIFLGLGIALSSIVVVTSLDYTNNFKSFPDFELAAPYSPMFYLDDKIFDDSFASLTMEEAEYLQTLDGVKKSEVIYGGFIQANPDDKAWVPYFKGGTMIPNLESEDGKEQLKQMKAYFYSTILIVEDSYLDQLEKYSEKNQLSLDIEGLRAGTSVISTAGSLFSKKLLASSISEMGEVVHLDAKIPNKKPAERTFGGYVDSSKEEFPAKHYSYMQNGPELMMSEASFDQLGIQKRPLVVNLYVEEEKEPFVKRKIKRFMEQKEAAIAPNEREAKVPSAFINSESLEAAQDEIRTMKVAMYSISFLLISLGLVNHMNTTSSSLLSRRSEIAVMESVGMTRKQLRKLLIFEGLYYSGIVSALLCTLGSSSLFLLFKVIHGRMGYAQFTFPMISLLVIVSCLFLVCISIPLIFYRRMTNQSVIERLRETNE